MVPLGKVVDALMRELGCRIETIGWVRSKGWWFERWSPLGRQSVSFNFSLDEGELSAFVSAGMVVAQVERAEWVCGNAHKPAGASPDPDEKEAWRRSIHRRFGKIEGEARNLPELSATCDRIVREQVEPYSQDLSDLGAVCAALLQSARCEPGAIQHPAEAATKAACAAWLLRDRESFDEMNRTIDGQPQQLAVSRSTRQ